MALTLNIKILNTLREYDPTCCKPWRLPASTRKNNFLCHLTENIAEHGWRIISSRQEILVVFILQKRNFQNLRSASKISGLSYKGAPYFRKKFSYVRISVWRRRTEDTRLFRQPAINSMRCTGISRPNNTGSRKNGCFFLSFYFQAV